MGGQQKDFISDIVFFQHQDGMRLKVRRHFLQCTYLRVPTSKRASAKIRRMILKKQKIARKLRDKVFGTDNCTKIERQR